ncbi:hypothetical protein EDC04DRAFT_2605974 [Pisolithus marmoratus]|nr:hypothetical protein EDC04DRAFT_2605974 [Pisolithus marmoratus]
MSSPDNGNLEHGVDPATSAFLAAVAAIDPPQTTDNQANVDVFERPSIVTAHFDCAFTVKAAMNVGSLSHAVQRRNISALYTVFDIWPAASKSRAAGKDVSASLGGTTSCVTSVKST